MDAGILRALKTVKDNRYVQYAGLGLAGLVQQEDQIDKETGRRKRKSKFQLIRISAAVCGIELCYAAETAFVSPILLKLGVPPSLMTMVWCLSPIVGFFLVPIMGSLSDRCRLRIGRRRPFIMILSLGIIFGLALVPNGQTFGVLLGDTWIKPLPFPPPPPPPLSSSSSSYPLRLQPPLYTTTTILSTSAATKSSIPNSKPISSLLETIRNKNNKNNIKQFSNSSYSSLLSSLLSPSSSSSSSSFHYEDIDFPFQQQQQQQQQQQHQQQQRQQQPQHYQYNTPNASNKSSMQHRPYYHHYYDTTTTTTTTTATTTIIDYYPNSIGHQNRTEEDRPLVSFSVPSEHLRGIILTILGVALLDFNCDACQSPCRAYLLDVSVPEDHSQGLTMFTVMAGAGGAVGYVMGGIDWNSTGFGEAFGGHIRVVFTLVLVAFLMCMMSTLTSFKEIPLSELNLDEEKLQKKKKKTKDKKKYRKFTNEEDDDSSSLSDNDDNSATNAGPLKTNYGALSDTGKPNQIFVSNVNENRKFTPEFRQLHVNNSTPSSELVVSSKDGECESNKTKYLCNALLSQNTHTSTIEVTNTSTKDELNDPNTRGSILSNSKSLNESESKRTLENANGVHGMENGVQSMENGVPLTSNSLDTDTPKEISPYTMRGDMNNTIDNDAMLNTISVLEVSTDVTLKTYLRSIVRMPRCMWVLCLTNLFCWMSLVCYSLYFTDFVGQAVFQGNPLSPVGSVKHNLYDEGIRLGSMGMSLYSLSCACYSLIIEKLVQRFRAKRVYVLGQLVYTVGMLVMSASRSKVAVILMSPTAGVMYATLFTMPYLLVAHYHARGMFSQSDKPGGEERQVRGLGTDVAIISSMVFLAQFLLSVFMGTAVSVLRSTTTVVVASSVLSFLGAITATQVTYLDL